MIIFYLARSNLNAFFRNNIIVRRNTFQMKAVFNSLTGCSIILVGSITVLNRLEIDSWHTVWNMHNENARIRARAVGVTKHSYHICTSLMLSLPLILFLSLSKKIYVRSRRTPCTLRRWIKVCLMK